jgi:hypothetical protein
VTADDKPRPAQKFGMPIAQAEPYAACQTAIAQERKLFADLRFANAVAALHRLRWAFDKLGIR